MTPDQIPHQRPSEQDVAEYPAAEQAPAEQEALETHVPWAAVAVFAVLACGLGWLATLPMWLGDGLEDPLMMVYLGLMMFAPTVAALVVVFFMVRPKRRARYLGLVPFRPVGQKITVILLWPVTFLALGFGAFFLAAWFGWVTPDTSLAQLRDQLPAGVTAPAYLAVAFAIIPINVAIGSMAAFGEELGWRGFLTTALSPLGFWPSALISGILWGVWHAPIVLLGYNFARPNLEGIAWMCGFTLVLGVLLQWSRYWTRNVWPAVVGHGAVNAVTPLTLLWLPQDADAATSTLLGAPGWIAMGILVLVLVCTGLLGRRNARLN